MWFGSETDGELVCVWWICSAGVSIFVIVFCRYLSNWIVDYQERLKMFFEELHTILPDKTLIIWNLTMPLGQKIKGGFLVPEVRHCQPNHLHQSHTNYCPVCSTQVDKLSSPGLVIRIVILFLFISFYLSLRLWPVSLLRLRLSTRFPICVRMWSKPTSTAGLWQTLTGWMC